MASQACMTRSMARLMARARSRSDRAGSKSSSSSAGKMLTKPMPFADGSLECADLACVRQEYFWAGQIDADVHGCCLTPVHQGPSVIAPWGGLRHPVLTPVCHEQRCAYLSNPQRSGFGKGTYRTPRLSPGAGLRCRQPAVIHAPLIPCGTTLSGPPIAGATQSGRQARRHAPAA